jgi:hypothetical protein
MVKTPKMRHSKPQRDPVTIDLGPEEVSRVEKAKAETAAGEDPQADASAKREPAKAGSTDEAIAEAATSTAAEPDQPREAVDSGPTMAGSFGRSPEQPSNDGARSDGTAAKASPPPARSGTGPAIVGGIAGAVIALLAGGGLQYAGLLSLPGGSGNTNTTMTDALEAEIAGLKRQVAELEGNAGASGAAELQQAVDASTKRADGLSASVEQLRSDVAALKGAAESGGVGDDAAVQTLDARLKALESTVASLGPDGGQVSKTDIDALDRKIAAIEGKLGSADDASTATGSRIAALESNVASLSARLDQQADQQADRPKVALAIATSALKAAVDRGGSFSAEVETFAAIAPDAPELPELRTLAEKGVPSRAQIAAAMPEAANAMAAAGKPVDQNAGFLDRLLSSAESLVTVRPVGVIEGNTVAAIVARMEAAVKKGDLSGALKEYETLPEAPKAAGAAFAETLKARLMLEELVGKALAGALKAA